MRKIKTIVIFYTKSHDDEFVEYPGCAGEDMEWALSKPDYWDPDKLSVSRCMPNQTPQLINNNPGKIHFE